MKNPRVAAVAVPDAGVSAQPADDKQAVAPVEAAPEPAAPHPSASAPASAETADEPTADRPGERPLVEQMTTGIRRVVDEHRDSIIDCYRRAARSSAAKDPLRGRLEVHLRILPAGDADDVRVVQNETGSVELGDCLVSMMQTWRYPGPGAEAMEFVWPFTFRGQR